MNVEKYCVPCRACKQFVFSMESMQLAKRTNYGKEWKDYLKKYGDIIMDTSDHDLRDDSWCILVQHKLVSAINRELAEEYKEKK